MSLNQNNKLKGGGGRGQTQLLHHFQDAFAACAEPHHCLSPQTLASCLLTKASGGGKNKFQYEKLLVLYMLHDSCCNSVGSAEDSLRAGGGGTPHADWLLHASPSVAGGDTVGATAPVPRPPLCLPVAGRDRAWSGTSLACCSACQWAQPQQAEEWHRHISLDKQKGDCSMMRNCDKSMTDL